MQAQTLSLSTTDWEKLTHADLIAIYEFIDSDGCTGVPDFYLCACIPHDFWYETAHDFDGTPITRAEADRRFRILIQRASPFGRFSPMSWWRWAGVRALGRGRWAKGESAWS